MESLQDESSVFLNLKEARIGLTNWQGLSKPIAAEKPVRPEKLLSASDCD